MGLKQFFSSLFFSFVTSQHQEKQIQEKKNFIQTFYQQSPLYFNDWLKARFPLEAGKQEFIHARMDEFRGKFSHDENANHGYSVEPSREFVELRKQIKKVIQQLKKWCDENSVQYAENWHQFSDAIFNTHSYLSNECAALMFSQGKEYMEHLLFHLYKKQANPVLSKTIMMNLCQQLTVCAPAVFANLRMALSNYAEDRDKFFQDVRLQVIQQSAAEFVHQLQKKIISEIHHNTAFVNYVAADYAIAPIEDENIRITADMLQPFENFKTHLEHSTSTIEDFFETTALHYETKLRQVENHESAMQFSQSLAMLGDDPHYSPYDFFDFCKKQIDDNKIFYLEAADSDDCLKARDDIHQQGDGILVPLMTRNQLFVAIKMTIFTRLFNTGYIQHNAFKKIKLNNANILYLLPDSAMLSFATSNTPHSKNVFFIDFFKDWSVDDQIEILQGISKDLSVRFFLSCYPYIKAEVLNQLISYDQVPERILLYLALKKNEQAVNKVISQFKLVHDKQPVQIIILLEAFKRGFYYKEEGLLTGVKLSTAFLLQLIESGQKDFSGADFSAINFHDLRKNYIALKHVPLFFNELNDNQQFEVLNCFAPELTISMLINFLPYVKGEVYQRLINESDLSTACLYGFAFMSELSSHRQAAQHRIIRDQKLELSEPATIQTVVVLSALDKGYEVPKGALRGCKCTRDLFIQLYCAGYKDFSGANFNDVDLRMLSPLNLNDVIFSDADLRGAKLSAADLGYRMKKNNAIFDRALFLSLSQANYRDFTYLNLNNQDLSCLQLGSTRHDFSYTNLQGVNFSCSTGAVLMNKAKIDKTAIQTMNREFRQNLQGCKLIGADFTGIDFSGADLRDVEFEPGVHLDKANLTGAILSEGQVRTLYQNGQRCFHGIHMTKAVSSRSKPPLDLRGADFSHANLENFSFRYAKLEGTSFVGARFSGSEDFTGTIYEFCSDHFRKSTNEYYKKYYLKHCTGNLLTTFLALLEKEYLKDDFTSRFFSLAWSRHFVTEVSAIVKRIHQNDFNDFKAAKKALKDAIKNNGKKIESGELSRILNFSSSLHVYLHAKSIADESKNSKHDKVLRRMTP